MSTTHKRPARALDQQYAHVLTELLVLQQMVPRGQRGRAAIDDSVIQFMAAYFLATKGEPMPRISLDRDQLAALLAVPVSRFHATSDPARAAEQSRTIADEVFRGAGRTLDGREWSEFPDVAAQPPEPRTNGREAAPTGARPAREVKP